MKMAESDGSLHLNSGNGTRLLRYITFVIALIDDFLQAIDHIIDDELFKLHLPVPITCRTQACTMKEWLGKPESKTTVQDFLLQFGQDVAEVVTNGKKLCAGREKMWTRYHSYFWELQNAVENLI